MVDTLSPRERLCTLAAGLSSQGTVTVDVIVEAAATALYELTWSCQPSCLPQQDRGIPPSALPTAQQAHLPVCSPHSPFAERQAEKLCRHLTKPIISTFTLFEKITF